MSPRHDEPPSLNLDQQGEALRLAARLQVRHDEAASMEGMYRAAEEAGIERRFLDEAVAQVATSPRRRAAKVHNSSARLTLLVVLAMLVAVLPFVPTLTAAALFGFLVALFPTMAGRAQPLVAAWVVSAWLVLDAAMWAAGVDVGGEFTKAGLVQLAGTFLGVVMAELAAATRERGPDRPQSL